MRRFSYITGALACAAGLTLWSAAAAAQGAPPKATDRNAAQSEQKAVQASKATQTYVEKAAIGDMFELQSSELALKQAESSDVKAFAQRMIGDHTKSTSALKAGIQSANLQVTVPDKLDKDHDAKLSNLSKVKGKDFDQAYMREQIAAHKEALQLHKTYAEKGDIAPLQKFAHNTATIVEHHLQEAEQIAKGGPPQSSSTR